MNRSPLEFVDQTTEAGFSKRELIEGAGMLAVGAYFLRHYIPPLVGWAKNTWQDRQLQPAEAIEEQPHE